MGASRFGRCRLPDLRQVRFSRNVDDGAFLGYRAVGSVVEDLFDILDIDPADMDPSRRVSTGCPFAIDPVTGPIRFDGVPVRQVGVEQVFQVRPQCGQFCAQRRDLVG